MKKNAINYEEGVSESIGFIIMFALVMTGIGLITLYGYPMLMKEQSNANIKNMERNMIVLQNDLKSLTFKNVPYQETDFQVSGGSLSIIPGSSVPRFSIVNNGDEITESMTPPGSLRYQSDREGAIISLENGAVLLRYQGQDGSVMLAEPRWFYDDGTTSDTLVIPIIRLTAGQAMTQTGVGRVRLKITNISQYNDFATGTSYLEYHQNDLDNFSTAWENYLKKSELHLTQDGSHFDIPQGTRLIVKTYNVTVLGL